MKNKMSLIISFLITWGQKSSIGKKKWKKGKLKLAANITRGVPTHNCPPLQLLQLLALAIISPPTFSSFSSSIALSIISPHFAFPHNSNPLLFFLIHLNSLNFMEKSRSVPEYSANSYYHFDCEDRNRSYNFNGPSSSSDPELKRKKRVASYNVLTMEAKLKSTVRNSFKWIKSKFTDVGYGS